MNMDINGQPLISEYLPDEILDPHFLINDFKVEDTKDEIPIPIQRPSDAELANMDKSTLIAILQFLKKHNLKETEELFKKETSIKESEIESIESDLKPNIEIFTSYKSEDDPETYENTYQLLLHFIDDSLDIDKCELSCLMYPIFVHIYLELVNNQHEEKAKSFFKRFSICQESYHEVDLQHLSLITSEEHMKDNHLMQNYRSSKFSIKILRESYNRLKRYLTDHKIVKLSSIIDDHLFIDVYEGLARGKSQIETDSLSYFDNNIKKEVNKTRLHHGLLKEPEITIQVDEDEEDAKNTDETKTSKKKKLKKESQQSSKKSRNDPHAPSNNRIPLPDLRDVDKIEKIKITREFAKKLNISSESLPSICFYTLLNSINSITSVDICDDSSMIATGFSDSLIKIWPLASQKLCEMKQPNDLELLDKEADNVMDRIMDDRTGENSRTLYGHSGPIHATSFHPDRTQLISASTDGTMRLWSLLSWQNLVAYRGHIFPVWDVKFGPMGHYFASASYDRTARLWSTDHYQPLRIFAGHLSDVNCIDFHPNCNYLLTGSEDKSIRLWDILSGSCVRILTGHRDGVNNVKFSPDGKHIASTGRQGDIILWDLLGGEMMVQLKSHKDTVHSLTFSREGNILASGASDNTVKLWDVSKIFSDPESDDHVDTKTFDAKSLEIGSFNTKSTPVFCTHFTRRNLLLASGPFLNSQ